ncbi:MAG: hypothetical protein FJY73_09770 [Candidatus Eisenbacteria bacterium]|nr:hypothetical protein [Candidatus Eisenbacteria bacterium]
MRSSHVRMLASLFVLLAAGEVSAGPRVAPHFGVRVRQEIQPNVFWFDPEEDDRNWMRYRTQAGLCVQLRAEHALDVRLVNEFRKTYEPDTKTDYSEIVLDRLAWIWTREDGRPFALTFGRQDIVWGDGFLIRDGTSLDGSRTMYMDGIRALLPGDRRTWDFSLMANPKRDPWVVARDKKRSLRDADQQALALRCFTPSGWEAALIGIGEKDPDGLRPPYNGWTLGLRREWKQASLRRGEAEVALQRKEGGEGTGLAFAWNAARARMLGKKTSGEIGFFYYSGESENFRAFRGIYGRWPKWSEMWVYSLIGEGGASEWRNLASPYFTLRRSPLADRPALLERLAFRATMLVPWAPEPNWEDRGLLSVIELRTNLARGFSGQLLWEWHVDGSYPKEMTENAHFMRWQIAYDLK